MSEPAGSSIGVSPSVRDRVLSSYRAAKSSVVDPQAKFNAALGAYCDAHPGIETPEARRAVARLIASGEALA